MDSKDFIRHQTFPVSVVHLLSEDIRHNTSGGIRLRKKDEQDGHSYERTDPCNIMGPLPRAAEADTTSLVTLDSEWLGIQVNTKRRRGVKEQPQYFNVCEDEKLKKLVLQKFPPLESLPDSSEIKSIR